MTRSSLLLMLALALPFALAAQDKPDFSGDWTLNAGKSDFGMMPAPEKLIMKIAHKDPEVKTTTTQSTPQGERTMEATLTTDGKETSRDMPQGSMKTAAKWDGATLVVNRTLSMQQGEVTIVEKWNLSEDKKTLTMTRNINSPMGELTQKQVLDKTEAK